MAPRIFFRFNSLFFIYFFEYETIETHARAFLPLNILAVGSVKVAKLRDKHAANSAGFYHVRLQLTCYNARDFESNS